MDRGWGGSVAKGRPRASGGGQGAVGGPGGGWYFQRRRKAPAGGLGWFEGVYVTCDRRGQGAALSPLAPARRCDFSNAGLGVPRRWAPPLPSLLLREVGGGVEPFTGDGGVGLQARGRCRHRDEGQGGEEGRLAGYPPASLWLARRGTKTALLQWLLVIPGGTDLLPAHAGRKDSECALV